MQLTQCVIPLVPVGTIDDSAFEQSDWIAAFVAQVQSSRATGVLCRARVYLAVDIATRMFGPDALTGFGEWNSPLLLTTCSPENEGLQIFADIALSEATARLE